MNPSSATAPARILTVNGRAVPRLFYGTAWKETHTTSLTLSALQQGFRAIDTANQRRYYDEAGVGAAIRQAVEQGVVRRDELFVQTKFTFRRGHDHRVPFDERASIPAQVAQSLASSLDHLGLDSVDSYVLHQPVLKEGIHPPDLLAWRALEDLHDRGSTRFLGISNVNLAQLDSLCQQARIPPQFVQNRCSASNGWDRPIRDFCSRNGLIYQPFAVLKLNAKLVWGPEFTAVASRLNRSVTQIAFRLLLDLGAIPISGTTSTEHMADNLRAFDFQLESNDIARLESVAQRYAPPPADPTLPT